MPNKTRPAFPAMDQLPCAVIHVDLRQRLESCNPAARELLASFCAVDTGSRDNALQTLVSRWLGPELANFSGYQTDSHRLEKECAGATEIRTFDVQLKRLRNEAGEPLGMLVVLQDITAQARLREALRRAYREMEQHVAARSDELARANECLRHYAQECRDSAERLRKLSSAVEQTADHVIITDCKGIIEYVNPAFERMTGFTREEAVGKTPRILKSGKLEPKFFETLWGTIMAGEVFRATFVNQKKSGELYYEEKTITPIRDEQGRIAHFVSVGRDVTERRQAEEGREKLIAELQSAVGKVKQLSTLLPICAHCRKIRDDDGYWEQLETYIRHHTDTKFTHGICPGCVAQHYGDLVDEMDAKKGGKTT